MMRSTILPLALLAACAVWTTVAQESEWNQGARDHILRIHNDYRRNEGGCQINKLEYDMDLEAQAKGWAEGCAFKHEMIKGRGENLAYSTYKNPENEMITDSAQGWFDEKNDFGRGQVGCQASCHYTQLVWHDTQKVGCYSTRCPNLAEANAKDAWYFVCFYTPMGNMIGEEPYKLTCDTPCRDGQTEDNGLCIGEAKIPCVNENEMCELWETKGECTNNPAFMEKKCKKACKICVSDDEEEEEGEEGSEEGGSTGEGPEEGGSTGEGSQAGESGGEGPEPGEGTETLVCKDNNENCLGWAASDQCAINPKYMLVNCRKSCKVCEGGEEAEGECVDKNDSCEEWAENGHCKINAGYMLIDCKKACGAC